jgi:1-acyl-sn-glycerol-3-phosphate acyltransferase
VVTALPLTFRLAAGMDRARLLRWRARAHRLLALVLRLIVRVEASGLEAIPREGPAIFAANHVNSLDLPLFLSLGLRADFTGIMGAEVLGKPGRLRLIPLFCDIVFAPRGAADLVLAEAADALARGDIIGILPEGRCSETGVMGPAYNGVARLSARSGVRVVAGAWYGQERLAANLRRLRRTTVRIQVGPAMALRASTDEEAQRETDRLMRAIAALLPPAYRGIHG